MYSDPLPTCKMQMYTALHDSFFCVKLIFDWKYRYGFRCFRCNGTRGYHLVEYDRIQCADCGYQDSPKANTIFEHSPLPLHKWLEAIILMADDKRAVSALELSRRIDVNYKTALFMLRRLRFVMGVMLSEFVEDKFFAGIHTVLHARNRRPLQVALITGLTSEGDNSVRFVPASEVQIVHELDLVPKDPEASWSVPGLLGSAISLLKEFFLGTYHRSPAKQYLQSYLDEFAYRFNRYHHENEFVKFFETCLRTRAPDTPDSTVPFTPLVREAVATYAVRRIA